MRPSQVKSILGTELYYEDWMGGNLENFLFYKGLLIGFRGDIDEHPNENSTVCMFKVKTTHSLRLWGSEITNATKQEIENLLKLNDSKFKVTRNNFIQCIEHKFHFVFNNAGVLDEVYFAI